MVTLTLVRGLPGSGKSTYAQKLPGLHFEADQFFEDLRGNYKFDSRLISEAHDWCYSSTVKALRCGYDCIVSNTFTKMWELERYLAIVNKLSGVEIRVVEMRSQYGNIHGVPDDKLKAMAARWQDIPQDWISNGLSVEVIE